MCIKLLFFLSLIKCYFCEDKINGNFSLVYKWNVIDYQWPTPDSRSQFINESKFIPQNCFIRDFKIWKNRTYVSLPRWKTGIPATLATFPTILGVLPTSPLLEPYPSWSMQATDDCFSLQSIHTIDTDSEGKLWVLDSGIVEEFATNRSVCPPKLVVFDLETNFTIIHVNIPSEVRWNSSILTTMALEKEKKIVYIADSNNYKSGFIVYNHTSGTFKRFGCQPLGPDETSTNVDYVPTFILPEFVSIALNTNRDKLYFSTADSSDLFNLNISTFLTDKYDISNLVNQLGSKGRSSKLISDSKGYMYFNIINQKSVAQWRESSWVYHYSPKIVLKSKLLAHWVSSLDVDEDGFLWIVSNRFHDYSNNRFKKERYNMRIFRLFVPRREKPRKPRSGFSAEYVVLILFVIIIGLIIIEILMFNSD